MPNDMMIGSGSNLNGQDPNNRITVSSGLSYYNLPQRYKGVSTLGAV
jgi:hypothetical protein